MIHLQDTPERLLLACERRKTRQVKHGQTDNSSGFSNFRVNNKKKKKIQFLFLTLASFRDTQRKCFGGESVFKSR